jgi:hypothetical protein
VSELGQPCRQECSWGLLIARAMFPYLATGVARCQGERRQIANDCFALAMKVDHYNAKHLDEKLLQIPFNFEEMKIAKGLGDEAA